jgi:hypothetical protein
MSAHPRNVGHLLLALTGPIVWAGHFFGVYLTEALLCSAPGPATGGQVRWIGAGLTVIALAVLMTFAVRSRYGFGLSDDKRTDLGALSSFAGPLTIVSILAVLWTSVPLFLLPACASGAREPASEQGAIAG